MQELTKQKNAGFSAGKRQMVLDRLTEAFSQGHLDMDSYEQRVESATQADTPQLLDDLIRDLPPMSFENGVSSLSSSAEPSLETPGIFGIMGDSHLSGNWLKSGRVSAVTVMGTTKLDLCDCTLHPGPTHIKVFTLMGDTHIIVPPSVPVRFHVSSIMADSRIEKSVNQDIRGARSWVEISGFVVMGDVKVTATKS